MCKDYLSSSGAGHVYSLLSAQVNNYKNSGRNLQLSERGNRYFILFLLFYLSIDCIAYNKLDRQDLTNHSPSILILIILKFSSDL